MKIMIVEDHAGMREVLKSIIALSISDTIQIIECESGEEAVAEYADQAPDCVLMDFELKQQMNGFEAIEAIYRQDPEALVVLVTSHASPSLRIKADELDLNGFVSKDNLAEITPILQTITST